jgi:hypothetical protein
LARAYEKLGHSGERNEWLHGAMAKATEEQVRRRMGKLQTSMSQSSKLVSRQMTTVRELLQ